MKLIFHDRIVDCTNRTILMGILNVSNDSPIHESIFREEKILDRAIKLHSDGADIIDIGAVSTSSMAEQLSTSEEIDRVCSAISQISNEGILTSIDTWNAEVAEAAIEAGVHLLNDVSGFRKNEMVAVAAQNSIPVCVMHMRGEPRKHYDVNQEYEDINQEVISFLESKALELEDAGTGQVWIDPGFEFGKSVLDNVKMFDHLKNIMSLDRPVLISASRKGFLAELLGHQKRQDIPELVDATLAFNVLCAFEGVHIVRVHDVKNVNNGISIVNGIRELLAEN
ncbi:MAG: dihydropteroate synthase [Dehalococcoidia bacterium]|nr:dihydropteroate synthase [Dehalococcoidia bacterium]